MAPGAFRRDFTARGSTRRFHGLVRPKVLEAARLGALALPRSEMRARRAAQGQAARLRRRSPPRRQDPITDHIGTAPVCADSGDPEVLIAPRGPDRCGEPGGGDREAAYPERRCAGQRVLLE